MKHSILYSILSLTCMNSASALADVLVCEPHVMAEAGYMEGFDISDWNEGDVEASPTGRALVLELDQLRKGAPVRKVLTSKSLPGQLKVALMLRDTTLTIDLSHEQNGRKLGRYRLKSALSAGVPVELDVQSPDAGIRHLEFGCGIPTGR